VRRRRRPVDRPGVDRGARLRGPAAPRRRHRPALRHQALRSGAGRPRWLRSDGGRGAG
jgi:hypothetical protein